MREVIEVEVNTSLGLGSACITGHLVEGTGLEAYRTEGSLKDLWRRPEPALPCAPDGQRFLCHGPGIADWNAGGRPEDPAP